MMHRARGALASSPRLLSDTSLLTWPLFGLARPPPVTRVQESIAASTFETGARYLGDERTMLAAGAGEPVRGYAWRELVLVGRSNAGKSTLLNALLGGDAREGRRAFVPVSRTPGETRALDFYGVGARAQPALVLVDTPGYGFSARGLACSGAWAARVDAYLSARTAARAGGPARAAHLARCVVLVDARRGLLPADADVLRALDARLTPSMVLLTKLDLVPGAAQRAALAARTAAQLGALRMCFPALAGVSAASGEGLPALRARLVQLAQLQRADAALDARHREQLRTAHLGAAAQEADDVARAALAREFFDAQPH
jgi:GTP-binding protein